jgi:hypothetical protein
MKKFWLPVSGKPWNKVTITVDNEDAHYLRSYRWEAQIKARPAGWVELRCRISKDVVLSLAQLIMGADPSQPVSHRDSDGKNNCRSNLVRHESHADRARWMILHQGSGKYFPTGFCHAGHDITGPTAIRMNKNGSRTCKECLRLSRRKNYLALKNASTHTTGERNDSRRSGQCYIKNPQKALHDM